MGISHASVERPAAGVVRFVAYSDYLCPWCWNVARCLEKLEREFAGHVEIEWRSYLLRPVAKAGRDLEKFKRYTESWLRPAAEPGAGPFRIWSSDEGPPTHSVPPHRVAKAAARVSADAFRRMHSRMMTAYFAENRDISSFDVLRELWDGEGLAPEAFEVAHCDEIEVQIWREFDEARTLGATGVPAIRRIDNDAVIVGAHPEQLYRQWIERSLERGEGLVDE
jgi:predicted DsbA family dithiol-disulfide isomerase